MSDAFTHALCFALGCFGHFEGNAKFVDGNEAEAFWCKRVAKDLGHPR